MSNKKPLRKVVDIVLVTVGDSGLYQARKMLLECGHLVTIPQDIYGEYHPQRRRCHKCAGGYPPDRAIP